MPATAQLTRPTFTDADSITAARFNSVTISSVIIPDATNVAEGVVRLAGDLTGTAATPRLATSGVTAGTYGDVGFNVPSFTVDDKGRITSAANRELSLPDAAAAVGGATPTPAVKGLLALAGDLTGTAASPQLVSTGVTAGTYGTTDQTLGTVPNLAAMETLLVAAGDVGRRIIRLTSTGNYFLAAAAGSGLDKWTLHAPIANGLFTIPTIVVDAKGRVISAGSRNLIVPDASTTVNGLIRIAGDLTGTAASPQLVGTGVTAGQYGVIETVANDAALAALTVGASDIGRRIVKVASSGLIYRANTVGTGLGCWMQPAPVAFEDLLVVNPTFDAKGRASNAEPRPVSPPFGLPSAWATFDGSSTASFRAGLAYARASNVVTVTAPAHGFRVGDGVSVDFTSGTGVTDGFYVVDGVPDANTFTFTHAGVNTGGSLTLEIFALRNARNVQSVVRDRRIATSGAFWINFQAQLANDNYCVTGMVDHVPGSYVGFLALNTTAGARMQTARGVSVYAANNSGGAVSANNVNLLVFGG